MPCSSSITAGVSFFPMLPVPACSAWRQDRTSAGEPYRGRYARANRLLQEAIAATEGGQADISPKGVAISLSPSGSECWLAHVLPLTASARDQAGIPEAATAAVFVRKASLENPTALETVSKLYKLTAMEVRVLQAVVEIGAHRLRRRPWASRRRR